jgi:hypothetical protein
LLPFCSHFQVPVGLSSARAADAMTATTAKPIAAVRIRRMEIPPE